MYPNRLYWSLHNCYQLNQHFNHLMNRILLDYCFCNYCLEFILICISLPYHDIWKTYPLTYQSNRFHMVEYKLRIWPTNLQDILSWWIQFIIMRYIQEECCLNVVMWNLWYYHNEGDCWKHKLHVFVRMFT